jgi:hypothetical protein
LKPSQIIPRLKFAAACVLGLCLSQGLAVHGAGVTIITHGFSGNADGWILGMAGKVPDYYRFAGTNVICYEMTVTYSGNFSVSSRKVAGGHPTNDFNPEIIIKLDWGALAGFFNQFDTYEVAAAVVPSLIQTNFIPELGGRALAELPIHLVGHSRGGSLVCEMARLLGTNGIWVDHLTTLDPHPVNENGNTDPLVVSDAPLGVYENVLFADNYYQEFGGYPHGQFMSNSYNRRLTALPGGYSSAHSDTHLWYHATVDLANPANDTEASLSAADRSTWFTTYENSGARAGFHYSLIGGGNRLSTDQPAGIATNRPVYGFNQKWNLGAGQTNNRTALTANNGNWPNIIRMDLTGTNFMAQGESNHVTIYAHWARPPSSNAIITVHLDDDFNPYNGNDRVVQQLTMAGNGANQISFGTVPLNVALTNSTPGLHSVFAKISGGGRTRYLYAPQTLTLMSTLAPPRLAISRNGANVRVNVAGSAGQRIVLQATTDFASWTPIATNWLSTDVWSWSETQAGHRFYRAAIQ